jgi:hypothetical protein
MNGYKAFYKGRTLDLRAETLYRAQVAAASYFKARKAYDVRVMLCETADGKQVVHTPTE